MKKKAFRRVFLDTFSPERKYQAVIESIILPTFHLVFAGYYIFQTVRQTWNLSSYSDDGRRDAPPGASVANTIGICGHPGTGVPTTNLKNLDKLEF